MRCEGANGSGETAGAGAAGLEFDGRAEADLRAESGDWAKGRVEGTISGMERYGHEGGAVYSDSVPAVGGDEGMEAPVKGTGWNYGGGKRRVWQRGWGGCCRGDDPARCTEDEDDAREGEAGCCAPRDTDFSRFRP